MTGVMTYPQLKLTDDLILAAELRFRNTPISVLFHSPLSPNVGITYGVSSDPNATGNVATVRYGETVKNANGSSGHVTWRGTAGTVKIDAAAKDTVSFTFSGVTAVVDPDSSQNLATGTMTLAGSGRVDDLLGFAP